ncbi:hypothetical protein [Aestuariimicrobium ganziense]|uniref:hypothetical protein n=1 Tax=Aestuariimicrobium ganziense TaxID=2773677 RepID=UPI0019452E44|nr:hypothetical protein [Aestuariimicrobium ganziense]
MALTRRTSLTLLGLAATGALGLGAGCARFLPGEDEGPEDPGPPILALDQVVHVYWPPTVVRPPKPRHRLVIGKESATLSEQDKPDRTVEVPFETWMEVSRRVNRFAGVEPSPACTGGAGVGITASHQGNVLFQVWGGCGSQRQEDEVTQAVQPVLDLFA